MKKTIFLVAAIAVAGATWWAMQSNKDSTETITETHTATPAVTPAQQAPAELPDYDTRKVEQMAARQAAEKAQANPETVMSSAEADALIAEKSEVMNELIGQYDAALHDPEAKRQIEKQYKQQAAEYKAAILAKVKKDEL